MSLSPRHLDLINEREGGGKEGDLIAPSPFTLVVACKPLLIVMLGQSHSLPSLKAQTILDKCLDNWNDVFCFAQLKKGFLTVEVILTTAELSTS